MTDAERAQVERNRVLLAEIRALNDDRASLTLVGNTDIPVVPVVDVPLATVLPFKPRAS